MKTYSIDSVRFSNREGFYDEIASVFAFPEYFGRNLDALADCLGDIEEPFAVVWKGADKSETELKDFFFEAERVFLESAKTFTKTESI